MKILLTSVFGPYGVDDDYGRKENKMELFHNQVTREQGLFSLRFNHPSVGLHFIAENINAKTTVLDFPAQNRFIKEIKKGYDYVGISFITPNFIKAKRMAELIRKHAPASKIILGGHGTRIHNIENIIPFDHICVGEGIFWFRKLLGEDPSRPLKHPLVPASTFVKIAGIPLKGDSGILIPGVGCPNACRFCATSHFFDKKYTPYFDTGKELFDVCCAYEKKFGYQDFFVMDENFLKRPQRAYSLVEHMEKHNKHYRFGIFSSAETIRNVGVDFLVRLGVSFLWVGVESKREVYEKNQGIDIKAMIHELRENGISVLASGILFLEHHDKTTIWEDINYLVDMQSDLTQFMQLGPMPKTKLYKEYERDGLLRKDIPYEEWHGQHRIWFNHPHFTGPESESYLRKAFQMDYDRNGSSLLRMCDTIIRGYENMARFDDPYMKKRRKIQKKWAIRYRPLFKILKHYAHTPNVRVLTDEIAARYERVLGPMTLKQKVIAQLGALFAALEDSRVKNNRTVYQPKTLVEHYSG